MRHKLFTRVGNDLIVTLKIGLADALAGYTVRLTTLDGRNLVIPIDSIIHPDYEEVVVGEGMPILKEFKKKGNLIIKFDIMFPLSLTPEQKIIIAQNVSQSEDED